jgi:zinc resistance-associated protein
MQKALVIGVAAILIANSSPVWAQQTQNDARSEQRSAMPSTEGRIDDRLSYLKETLRLSPEQERNWPAYESALQALSNLHSERMAGQDQSRPTDPTPRLRQRAAALSKLSAVLSRVADAQETLYNSLDEAQKRRFADVATASLDRMRGARSSEDERGGRYGRPDDFDRRRDWRDGDYDRRDREYHYGRRYSREYDSDRDWRERDYRRRGWRDRDDDGRDNYYNWRRRYGDYERDGGWRGREYRGWRDRDYDRRDRDQRGSPD